MRDPYVAPWQHLAAAVGLIFAMVTSAAMIGAAIDRNTQVERSRMCFDHPSLMNLGYCVGVRE